MIAQSADAATTRKQATKTALKVLKVQKGTAPVVVFNMLQPLPRNATITELGPAKYASARKVKPTVLGRTGPTERAWMFYADTSPYGQYQHAGRIVLVSMRTGRVLLNKPTKYSPMVNGKLPPFLGNSRRYESKTWRVFYRAWRQSPKAVTVARSTLQADPGLRADLAKALGTQNTCVVVAGARGPGIAGEVSARSATFVEWYFRALAKLDGGVGVWRYQPTSSTTLADFLEEVASEQPCNNILLYLAGQATATGDPLVMLDTKKVQEIRAKQILKLLRAHRSTKVSIVLDASQSARFYGVLKNEPNLVAYLAPRGTKNVAFGYLPEMQVGKKVVKNAANPRRILEFTNDLLYGLNVFTTSPSEVQHAISQSAGENGSTAAWMLGRGDRIKSGSGVADRIAGVGADELHERVPSSPPPPIVIPNTGPIATSLTATTNEDAPLALPLAATDPQSDPFSFEVVTQPAHGTVVIGGAAPATYTPAANYHGPDSFTYRAVDVRGGIGDPVTVTITVLPIEDAPTVLLDAAATYTEGDPVMVLSPTATLTDVDEVPHALASATVSIATDYVNGEDELHFVDTADILGSWDPLTGTLTLTGAATSADYQAALRTITYENLAGPATTEGTRTIAVVLTSDTGATSSGILPLAVIAQNDAPTSADFSITATEDVAEPFTFTGTDIDGDVLDYVVVTPPTHGAITGTGASRTYTPDTDYAGSDTFTFHAEDPKGATSADHTVTVTVTAVNDAPVVTLDPSLSYAENALATVLSPAALVTDVDDTNLTGAVVSITTGFAAGQDVLAFTDTASITGNYVAGTGVLTLTGTATVAEYQAAIRSITYVVTSDTPSTAARTISVTASDAALTSIAATMQLNVSATNDAPTATSFPLAVDEDTPEAFTLTGTDPEGDALTFTIVTPPSYGNVSGTSPNLTYTPNASYSGSDSFTFTADDGNGGTSALATATITVANVNSLPVVTLGAPISYTENDAASAFAATATVTDSDSASLTGLVVTITGCVSGQDVLAFVDAPPITGVYVPGTCTMTLSGTATPAAYEAALRTITYRNSSDDPAVSARTFSVTTTDVEGATSTAATKGLTVVAQNDAPTVTASGGATAYSEQQPMPPAVDGGLTVTDVDSTQLEGATVTIASGRDTGDALNFSSPQNGITGNYVAGTGILTLTGQSSVANYQTALRSVTFSSSSDAPSAAARVIEFVVRDAALWSSATTKTVNVTPVNDVPTITGFGAGISYTEGNPGTQVTAGPTIADADNANMSGASVRISVGCVPAEDVLTLAVQPGITGIYTAATCTLALSGTASIADYQTALSAITYTNSSNAPTVAARTISATVTDTATGTSAAATKSLTVTGTNTAPTVTASGGATTYTEDAAATAIDTSLLVADVDDTNLTAATVTIASGRQTGDALAVATQFGLSGSYNSTTGVLTISGAPTTVANFRTVLRSVTFVSSNQNPTTTRAIEFTVSDASLTSSATTKNITITPVNDAPTVTPTVAALAYTENAGAVAVDNGVVVGDVDSTTLQGATVTLSANYQAGEDTLLWTDNNVGDTITLNAGSSSSQTIVLQGSGSLAQYQLAMRAVTYTNSSETPSATPRTASITATDGALTSTAGTRTINVTPVDDPPVAVDDTATVARNASAVSIPVMANDTDIDAGPKTIASVTQPANGTVVRAGDGSGLTYQPNPTYCNDDASPDDTFTYTLTGGSTATVSVVVTCAVNMPPDATNFTLTGNDAAVGNTPFVYNGPADGAPSVSTARKLVAGGLLSHATDPDVGDTLTVTANPSLTTTNGAKVAIEADGDFVYTPNAGCVDTTDSFDFTVTDGGGLTDTATATINIAGCVWYVRNNAAGGGAGDADHPFTTLAAANSAAGASANHVISVAKGDGTSTGLTGAFVQTATQSLMGEGGDLVVDPDGSGATYAPSTLKAASATDFPILTHTGGAVVTAAANSTISGVQIDPDDTGWGIDARSRANLVISHVRIIDAGIAAAIGNMAIEGNSTTTNMQVSNLMIDTRGIGVRLDRGSATFASAGTISITTTTELAISHAGNGTSSLTAEFDEITVTGGTSGAITMGQNTAGGSVVLGSTKLDLTTASFNAAIYLTNSGTVSVPAASTATINSAGPALNIATIASASSLYFDTVNVPSSPAGGITWNPGAASTASLTVAGGTVAAGTAAHVVLSSGTGNVDMSGMVIGDGSAANNLTISARSAGTVKIGQIVDGADPGGGVTITSLTGGSIQFTKDVTINSNTNSNGALAMVSSTGGTITYDDVVNVTNSGTAAAVFHSGTTSTLALNFNGGLRATATGTGRALETGQAIMTVLGTGNTLTSGSGTALRAASTSFGTGGVTFQSISSNGATNGIYLNGVGTTGFLTVTGNGGTCSSAATCTGGAIQNTLTAGQGMILTDVRAPVSFTRMSLDGPGDGILSATRLHSFTLDNSRIVGVGDAVNDTAIEIVGSSGTNAITNSVISNSYHSNLVINQNSALPTTWTVTGNTFAAAQHNNVSFTAAATSQTSGFTFTGNTLTGGSPAPVAGTNSILLSIPTLAQNRTLIENNDISGAPGHAIAANIATSSGTHYADVTINNNRIGTATAGSGSSTGRGISFDFAGVGKLRALVTNNQIRHYFTNGIYLWGHAAGAAGRFDATLTGNTLSDPDNVAGTNHGIYVQAGTTGTDLFTMCFDIGGAGALANSFAGSANGASGTGLDFGYTRNGPTVNAAGWDGIAVPSFATYLTARNTGTPTIGTVTGVQTTNPASCTLPTLP